MFLYFHLLDTQQADNENADKFHTELVKENNVLKDKIACLEADLVDAKVRTFSHCFYLRIVEIRSCGYRKNYRTATFGRRL